MPAIASSVGPAVLPASNAAPAAAPGVPSLAAFVELMAGQGTPPPGAPLSAKGAAGTSGRQADADPGKPLPDGDDPQPDPALAWMFAAPTVVAPLPLAKVAMGGAASRVTVDLTTMPAPTLPTGTTLPPTTGDVTTPVAADDGATPEPVSGQTAPSSVRPFLQLADAPPAVLVATPVPQPIAAAPVAPPRVGEAPQPVVAPLAAPPTVSIATRATPPLTTADAPPSILVAPLVQPTTPPAAQPAAPTFPTADAPPAIVVADAPAPVTATPTAVTAPPQPTAPATPARFDLPRASAPRPVAPAPVAVPATRSAAPVQPALFALAALTDRPALDRDERTATTPADPLVAIQSAAPLAVAATGDAQRTPLDLAQRDWPQKMIEHIETLRDAADATDTSIRLKPEALGRVEVALRTHDDGAISVRFTAEQPTTRALIADAAPQLAQAAEARGIRLSGTSVDLAGSGQHDQRARPQVARHQPTANHRATPSRGDDTDAVTDGRIA